MKRFSNFFCSLLCILILLLNLSCNRSDQDTSNTSASHSSKSSFSSELLRHAPENSLGFIHVNYESEGSKGFLMSPLFPKSFGVEILKSFGIAISVPKFETPGSKSNDLTNANSFSFEVLEEILSSVFEMKLENFSSYEKLVSEALFFFSSAEEDGATKSPTPVYGGIIKFKPQIKIPEKIEKIVDILKKRAIGKIVSCKTDKGEGYEIVLSNLPKLSEITFYLLASENKVYLASNKAVLDKSLIGNSTYPLKLAENTTFNSFASELSPDSERVSLVYLDLKPSFKELNNSLANINESSSQKIEEVLESIEGFIIDTSYSDSAIVKARLSYTPKGEFTKSLVNFKTDSDSAKEITKGLHAQSIVAVALDFGFINNLFKNESLLPSISKVVSKNSIDFFASIKKMLYSFKNSDQGSSFMPIPDLSIQVRNAENSDISKYKAVGNSIFSLFQKVGTPQIELKWESKTIDNLKVEYAFFPGMKLFLHTSGKDTFISNNVSSIKDSISLISGSSEESFANKIPRRVYQTFTKQDSVGSFYFSFPLFADILEEYYKMYSAFIPKSQNIDKRDFFSDPNFLKEMRSKGYLVFNFQIKSNLAGVDIAMVANPEPN